jgi:hypothetical protein
VRAAEERRQLLEAEQAHRLTWESKQLENKGLMEEAKQRAMSAAMARQRQYEATGVGGPHRSPCLCAMSIQVAVRAVCTEHMFRQPLDP